MSVINNALSELANKQSESKHSIEKADIVPVKRRTVLPWVVGTFALTIAVGGWAVSQQSKQIRYAEFESVESHLAAQIPEQPSDVSPQTPINSPTQRVANSSSAIYSAQSKTVTEVAIEQPAAVSTQKTHTQSKPAVHTKPVEQPMLIAKVDAPAPKQSMMIEQVELTKEQLARNAVQRAKKAIDANNIQDALSSFNEALRHTPYDEKVRQQYAALFYGKGDARKAFEILQSGIQLNLDGETLRIALSKMLIKEKQHEAALTPLVPLSDTPSLEYLSLRAALAQKADQDDLALDSYQRLVSLDAENARWWLGLAIQQERQLDLESAKAAYQKSLTTIGISTQSQAFARERLKLIRTLQESGSEN
ncbi:MSHA biogenesis protein MshN [Vibrio astriarenae]|uniref:MSHA biogenesis protein MshN n=1 Tax=Vibrio astriarenae TaxID=1481923 RepID=A0A7Z2T4R9_9VIBR|nr:MSHA biogenesis protein MshN [Vibrio astriarenae]QIA64311.1 MSHA biogenesis protein MshN [Vibrio astriarenae]